MAAKTTFISLGPAALQILELDRKIRRSEYAKKAANKRLNKWLAQQVYEGNYEEFSAGQYMVEGSRGRWYDVTDQVEAQLAYEEDKDEFDLYDLVFDDDGNLLDEDDYDATDETEDLENHRFNLIQAVYEKTLQYVMDYTPVDSGNLIDSIYTNFDGMSAVIGFDMHTAPYAVYQHENTALHHVNGTAKYLEKAVLEALTVVDQDRELHANILIQGLHEGAKLEAQISFTGQGNLDDVLGDRLNDEEFMRAVQREFDHDFMDDIQQAYGYLNVLEELGANGLLDADVMNSVIKNRRMNMKTLKKVTEEQLQNELTTGIKAGNAQHATTALSALMLKRRFNIRKAQFKIKNAHHAGIAL